MFNDTAAHLGLFISNLNISCLQNRSLVSRIKTSSPESKLRFQNRSFFYGIESLFPNCYSNYNSKLHFENWNLVFFYMDFLSLDIHESQGSMKWRGQFLLLPTIPTHFTNK